jgi:hypothetical protein
MYNSEVYNCQTNPNSSSIYIGIESEHQIKSHHTGGRHPKHAAAWGSSEFVHLGKEGTVCSLSAFPPES